MNTRKLIKRLPKKRMKFNYLYLPLLLLVFGCNESKNSKTFTLNNKTQKSDSEFFVEFEPLSKQYVDQKRKDIEYYYTKLIGTSDFMVSFSR